MKNLRNWFVIAFALMSIAMVGAQVVDRYNTTYETEVKSLNYFLLLDKTGNRVAANTQDGLVENDRFGRYVPSLAESWTTNESSTEWTFRLRKGIKWTDSAGKATTYEITADDFVEGLRFVADPANGIKNVGTIRKLIAGLNTYYYDLADIDAGKKKDKTRDQVLAAFDTAVGVKAVDAYTVKYTLSAPTPYFLSYLVTELFFPVDREFLKAVGAKDFGTARDKLLFSGAYYLSDWQRDKQLVLTRNENYWDRGKISVKTISMQKVTDPAISVQMFQRGEVASATLQGDQVKALQGSKWAQYVFLEELSSVTYWFDFNFTSSNPEFKAFANNLNFRKALYYGIDRVKLLGLYDPFGPAELIRNTVIPEGVVTDEKGRDYTDYPGLKEIKAARNVFDKVKAREYFAKAVAELTDGKGVIKGVSAAKVDMKPVAEFQADGKLPLQILYVTGNDATDTKFAQLFKAILEDALGKQNVEVVLGQYVDDLFNEIVEPRRFDMLHDSFSFKFADPMAQLGRLITKGGINDGQYSDPEFDKLVADADAKTALSERYKLFSKAEKLLLDRVYVMPMMAGGGAYTMTKIVPFTYPRGGFGVTRFKYKGMIVEKDPITAIRYEQLQEAFFRDLEFVASK